MCPHDFLKSPAKLRLHVTDWELTWGNRAGCVVFLMKTCFLRSGWTEQEQVEDRTRPHTDSAALQSVLRSHTSGDTHQSPGRHHQAVSDPHVVPQGAAVGLLGQRTLLKCRPSFPSQCGDGCHRSRPALSKPGHRSQRSVRQVWPSPALPDSVGGRSVPHPNFHGDSGPTTLGCKPAVGLLRRSGEEDTTNCFNSV